MTVATVDWGIARLVTGEWVVCARLDGEPQLFTTRYSTEEEATAAMVEMVEAFNCLMKMTGNWSLMQSERYGASAN